GRRDAHEAHRTGCAPAELDGLRHGLLQTGHELARRDAGAVADLDLVHPVDQLAADLRRDLLAAAHLAHALANRVRLRCADHVRHHRSHVPVRAVRRLGPLVGLQAPQEIGEPPVLGRRQSGCLPLVDPADLVDLHGVRHRRLLFTWARNMSTTSSIRRYHRRPPGSLAICWSTSPLGIAVHRSTSAGSVMPWRANRARTISRVSTAMAYDSGEGSKPGIVRWHRSW